MCNKMLAPVCGTNKQTYANACVAKCAGVSVEYKGKCGVIADGIKPPVVTDGITFATKKPIIADGSNWQNCNKTAIQSVSCKCGYDNVTQDGCLQLQCKKCDGACAIMLVLAIYESYL